MKTPTLIAALVVLFGIPTFGQKHALTVTTCQADVALWYSPEMSIEWHKAQTAWTTDKVPNRTEANKLSLDEVTTRQEELGDCWQVDEEKRATYEKAGDFYYSIFATRLLDFIDRHKLWGQLNREDAAGQR